MEQPAPRTRRSCVWARKCRLVAVTVCLRPAMPALKWAATSSAGSSVLRFGRILTVLHVDVGVVPLSVGATSVFRSWICP